MALEQYTFYIVSKAALESYASRNSTALKKKKEKSQTPKQIT